MAKNNKIELTPHELEELKDDIKFRTKVMVELKQLNGIPDRVLTLEVSHKLLWPFVLLMIAAVVGAWLK